MKSPRISSSPSSASLSSTPGRRRPDGADPHLARPVARAGGARLRHPPQLRQLDPDRVEELDHLGRRRRGADVDRDELVEPEHRAQARRTSRVGLLDGRRQLRRDLLARAGAAAPPAATASSAPCTRARASSGWRAEHRLEPGLQLLPHARDGEEPGRAHLRQHLDDPARVRADRDRAGVDDRDVRGARCARRCARPAATRSPSRRAAGRSCSSTAPTALRTARCVELDALRRPGRARRVDQRQDVVGLHRARAPHRRRSRGWSPRRRRAAIVPSGASPSTTITCSRSGSSRRASSIAGRCACSTIATRAPASATT